MSQEALSLLAPQLPVTLLNSDIETKKSLLESLARMALGNLAEAEQHLFRAETLSANRETEIAAEVMAVRGILELRRSRFQNAETIFRKVFQLTHQQNYPFIEAAALLNLSAAAVHQHHYDEAIDWSNHAYQLAGNIGAGLTEEKALGNLGWVYYQMGDLEKSLALSLDAEKKSRDLEIVKDQIRWLYNAGAVYHAQNQFALAQDYYGKSLALAEQIHDQDQMMNALSSLSSVSVQQQRFDLAEQYSQKTMDLAHSQNSRLGELYALLTKGQIAVHEAKNQDAQRVFDEIVKDPATEAPLLWQAQNELALLFEKEDAPKAADKQYQAALSTLECARGSIAVEEFRLSFLTNAGRLYDEYIDFLVRQGKTEQALQTADYSRAQTLLEGLGVLKQAKNCSGLQAPPVDLRKAARQAQGTVLFYWLGQQHSYLWIVDARNTSLMKLPAAADIESLVQKYRKSLLDPPDVLQTRDRNGIELYSVLASPAQHLLAKDSPRVTIIADGVLNNLNFETLLSPEPKLHYWIEDVTITNASSLRMLASSRMTSSGRSRNLLLIGDPVVPDVKFPPLLSAPTEMQNIEKHFPAETRLVLSGTAANPSAFFKSKPESFSYIHFVAHGTASQVSPLDSAVILSKSTSEEDSYKLHARDILSHPLHADLAVISTCYGSGTTVYNGEGLVGLSWAFLRAGTHNVVGALWAVSDTSTPQLMDRLYAELAKGRSPQDALRTAKLSLLHSENTFRKPIYWAPFQLYTGS